MYGRGTMALEWLGWKVVELWAYLTMASASACLVHISHSPASVTHIPQPRRVTSRPHTLHPAKSSHPINAFHKHHINLLSQTSLNLEIFCPQQVYNRNAIKSLANAALIIRTTRNSNMDILNEDWNSQISTKYMIWIKLKLLLFSNNHNYLLPINVFYFPNILHYNNMTKLKLKLTEIYFSVL